VGFARLLRLLGEGRAVPVLINPQACSSLLETVDPELVPFLPAHWVVAHGWDGVRREVVFFDNRHFGPLRLAEDAFRAARSGGRGVQNPLDAWIEIEPGEPLPIEVSLGLALRQAARALRAIDALHVKGAAGFHVGIDGLRRFARQAPTYAGFMSVDELRQTALRLRTSLTVAGAAKDGLRGLQARFLESAARSLALPELHEAALATRSAARLWQRLDHAWRDVATAPESLGDEARRAALGELLRALAAAEQLALQRLEEALAIDDARRRRSTSAGGGCTWG
jgi:Domain of unknown function (DUF4872)